MVIQRWSDGRKALKCACLTGGICEYHRDQSALSVKLISHKQAPPKKKQKKTKTDQEKRWKK